MLAYADLEWSILFPFLCAVMMWFSIDLALLARTAGGGARRRSARKAIEQLLLHAPAVPSDGNEGKMDGAGQASAGNDTSSSRQRAFKKVVEIPAAMRVATKAVARRAVVVVGGDFARSPRMQYHAASLAQSGLFDEIVLVGLDYGNQLSEALRSSSAAAPEAFYLDNPSDPQEVERVVRARFKLPHDRRYRSQSGCLISTRYLVSPPAPPEWLQLIFPVRAMHWLACTMYRLVVFTLVFSWRLACAMAIRVNAHGQLLLTDLVIIQTPPAVPFVLLVKFLARPLCFLYSALVYYGFIVPAAGMNRRAMRDVREQSCPLTGPFFAAEVNGANGSAPGKVHCAPSPSSGLSSSKRTSGTGHGSIAGVEEGHVSSVEGAPRGEVLRWWRAGRVRWCVFWPAVVVDWHNLGYTILQAAHRPAPVVQLYRLLEQHFCAGDVNLTVSRAMKRGLTSQGYVPADAAFLHEQINGERSETHAAASGKGTITEVVYDVAPSFFGPCSRRTFVDEVLLPISRRVADSEVRAEPAFSTTSPPGSVWGIAPPPAWMFEEAADSTAVTGNATVPASSVASAPDVGMPAAASIMPATVSRRKGLFIVGSTSWTEDDDYSILVEALQRLDHRLKHAYMYLATGNSSGSNGSTRSPPRAVSPPAPSPATGGARADPGTLPIHRASSNSGTGNSSGGADAPLDVWVLITGKGPARDRFEDAVQRAGLSSHIVVSTVYLQSYRQYGLVLGAADVGLCLHLSSSGLDLPMKGVDMIGSGLPVLALGYPAVEELMGQSCSAPSPTGAGAASTGPTECARGWIFRSAADLEKLLGRFIGLDRESWSGEPVNKRAGADSPLPAMRERLRQGTRLTWESHWNAAVRPILEQIL